MEIIRTSKDLTKIETYALTQDQVTSIKDLEDCASITVGIWAEYSDVNAKDEVNEILSIQDNETGAVYSTISETFKREFFGIMDLGLTKTVIIKDSGVTNAGRDFVFCKLDTVNSVE